MPQASGAVGRAVQNERFFQLSRDMGTIRWSWSDYLLIEQITDVRYNPAKPLHFAIHYAHFTSVQNDFILTLVCKRLRHATRWVLALQLLLRAHAHGWDLPTHELTRLQEPCSPAAHSP